MLIAICGGICAGKHAVQDYLVERHGFQALKLDRNDSTPSVEKSASDAHVPELHDDSRACTLSTAQDLVDFVTKNWKENYVTTSIYDESIVDALSHRPFFILLHIDAPISTRWQRFKDRCESALLEPPSLEQFVIRNDRHLYDLSTGLAALASRAQIKLLNTASTLPILYQALDALNLTDQSRLRPTWDHYFMTLASLAARRSNCMRRQVGCVLVREKRVISTGYNGTPRHITNCNEGGCPRCNSGGGGGAGLATCLCIHAEENALLEAGRERVGGGAVLYCNTCPCLTCSIKIVQVGITEVVYNQSYYMDAEAAKLFTEAGVKLRQFSPPKEGLANLCDADVEEIEPAPAAPLTNGHAKENGTHGINQDATHHRHGIAELDQSADEQEVRPGELHPSVMEKTNGIVGLDESDIKQEEGNFGLDQNAIEEANGATGLEKENGIPQLDQDTAEKTNGTVELYLDATKQEKGNFRLDQDAIEKANGKVELGHENGTLKVDHKTMEAGNGTTEHDPSATETS